MMSFVTKEVEQHREEVILDVDRPFGRQRPVAVLDRGNLLLAIYPGGQRRQEDVLAGAGHVAPPGGPLLIHRHRVAVHPEQVHAEIPQKLVSVCVLTGRGPRGDLRAGWRLDLEVAANDSAQLLHRIERREIRLWKEVGREDELPGLADDKRFHAYISMPPLTLITAPVM